LTFCTLVVLPVGAAMWATTWSAERARLTLQRESLSRVARLALRAVERSPDNGLNSAAMVGRLMRARVGVYMDGAITSASDPAPSVSVLDRELLVSAAAVPAGVPLGTGILMAGAPGPGAVSTAALAESRESTSHAVSIPVRVVIALLLLLSALAVWILLLRTPADPEGRERHRAAVSLLALVPALATFGLMVHVGRDFEKKSAALLAGDLTRALAVIETMGLAGSPQAINEVSAFHAVRVTGGLIDLTTFDAEAPKVEALHPPPPSFTTSGLVGTPAGPARYVARRLGPGTSVVVLAAVPVGEKEALRLRSLGLGSALLLWLLVAGYLIESRRRKQGA
jgi:hypothetical protein